MKRTLAVLAAAVALGAAAPASAAARFGLRAQPAATAYAADAAPTVTTGSFAIGWQARTSAGTPAWLVGELSASDVGWHVDVLGVKLALLEGRISPFVDASAGVGGIDEATRPGLSAGAGVDLLLGKFFVEASGKYRIYRDAPEGVRTAVGVSQLTGGVGAGWLF